MLTSQSLPARPGRKGADRHFQLEKLEREERKRGGGREGGKGKTRGNNEDITVLKQQE